MSRPLPYATIVFFEIMDGEHRGTHITFSEEETVALLKNFLFDETTGKLKDLDDSFPNTATLESASHLNAYDLAAFNNNNRSCSQPRFAVCGSIGGVAIDYCN
jgi:hypothetical protein